MTTPPQPLNQHVYKENDSLEREHETYGEVCWCDPITNYIDPVTGGKVIVHRTLEA